jgi:hypothetical protein
MDEDPFKDINEERLFKIFKKHHFQQTTWNSMKEEYLNWRPEFDPSLVNNYQDQQFIVVTNQFFNFKKSFTVKTRKAEFNKWLKTYWEYISSDNFEELFGKIIQSIQDYNEENPEFQVPFINWIPSYGGLVWNPLSFRKNLNSVSRLLIRFLLSLRFQLKSLQHWSNDFETRYQKRLTTSFRKTFRITKIKLV